MNRPLESPGGLSGRLILGIPVLFNPSAGAGLLPEALDGLLKAHLPGATLHLLSSPSDVNEQVDRVIQAGDGPLVLAGGDGLVSLVVNALAPDFSRIPIGLVPLGTGNDLARSLGIPLDAADALRLLHEPVERSVDVVRVHWADARPPAHFVNVGLLGFGATIELGPTLKRRLGGRAYTMAAIGEIRRLRAHRVVLRLDEEALELEAYLVAVANGAFMGGGVAIAPNAQLDDGELDLVIVPRLPPHRLVRAAAAILRGRQRAGRDVIIHRRGEVSVHLPTSWVLNADGEQVEGHPTRFEVLPAALRFRAPIPG
jgi:diacylglycerol kinase (ATP)